MTVKTIIATAFVALSLLSTAVTAQASDYPRWADRAFENLTN